MVFWITDPLVSHLSVIYLLDSRIILLNSWGLGAVSRKSRNFYGWHNSLCTFKTKASRGTKLCSYFYYYCLYNIRKDQLYRISGSEFYEWLFGLVKFPGLLRNARLDENKKLCSWTRWYLKCASLFLIICFFLLMCLDHWLTLMLIWFMDQPGVTSKVALADKGDIAFQVPSQSRYCRNKSPPYCKLHVLL